MGGKIDARDVLDPDGKTRRGFVGRIVGHFRPTGSNSWDPYEFVLQDGGTLDVLPGLKIQLETRGPRFRMRRQGQVIRVEWVPAAGEDDGTSRQRRQRFVEQYIETFDEAPGKGAGYLAGKLRR